MGFFSFFSFFLYFFPVEALCLSGELTAKDGAALGQKRSDEQVTSAS